MRVSRTHSVIAGLALAATLAGGGLISNADAAPRPHGGTAHHVVAAASPTAELGALGNLGAVQADVAGIAAAASAKPAPNPSSLTAQVTKLTGDVTALKSSLPAAPVTTAVKPGKVISGKVMSGKHVMKPQDAVGDALTKLTTDVKAIVSALPNPTNVLAAITAVVTDLLGVVTAVVAALGLSLPPLPVPIPVP